MTQDRRTELELFQALGISGNTDDFSEFNDRLQRCAWWVLNRRAWGKTLWGEVEEIVGAVRVRLEGLRVRGFNGNAPQFKSYLYQVVASVCIDAAKRRHWTDSLDSPVVMSDGEEKPLRDVAEGLVSPALGADAALAETEEGRRVQAALARLDPRCQALLREFHVRETSIKDLAEQEGARVNTIEVALTRCRARLYAVFLSSYVDAGDGEWRARVSAAGRRLSGQLARMFSAWWDDNRSVSDVSKELGVSPVDGKALLARAKREVWRFLQEGGAR